MASNRDRNRNRTQARPPVIKGFGDIQLAEGPSQDDLRVIENAEEAGSIPGPDSDEEGEALPEDEPEDEDDEEESGDDSSGESAGGQEATAEVVAEAPGPAEFSDLAAEVRASEMMPLEGVPAPTALSMDDLDAMIAQAESAVDSDPEAEARKALSPALQAKATAVAVPVVATGAPAAKTPPGNGRPFMLERFPYGVPGTSTWSVWTNTADAIGNYQTRHGVIRLATEGWVIDGHGDLGAFKLRGDAAARCIAEGFWDPPIDDGRFPNSTLAAVARALGKELEPATT